MKEMGMKHQKLLSRMSLKDKIALCSGKNAWETKAMARYGIGSVFLCDGPHGLRRKDNAKDLVGLNQSRPATCFPTAVSTACSWDPALLEEMGAAMGEEAASMGVSMVLGPGANLKRDPRCGRNFEYFSEDPCLAGKLAAGEIRGLQKNGVAACLKHFACNSQEYKRCSSDSVVDERTLRELYLTAFEIAVRESDPAAVMCAYNKLNGVYCSDNGRLLTEILREEWGFDGLVVTDWGALHDRTEAFRAGCDLAMPGGSAYLEREALRAVQSGVLPQETVDRSADRVLRLLDRQVQWQEGFDAEAHHALARKIAGQSAVLLQNEGGLLPLAEVQSVALFGHMAQAPRYQGAGSSHINPTRLPTVCQVLPELPYASGCLADGSTNDTLLAEAARVATEAEVAVVFAGLTETNESEGYDREHLRMTLGHVKLIETVAAANPNTVVVLTCGGVVECPWAKRVKAVVYMGLPGQAGAEAVADVLYGRVNPSGRLAETWPVSCGDCPTAESYGSRDGQYREGLYVGYRYYDKGEKQVRWPFGHGLSYTEFAYSDLQIIGDIVTVRVTNTGDRAGAEVVQLYVLPPKGGLHRPEKELKGFLKIFLEPGQTKTVGFQMEDRSFAVWQDGWVVPGGVYTVALGRSSRDLVLTAPMPRQGVTPEVPAWQAGSWYENPNGTPTPEQWQPLLGRVYEERPVEKGGFTMENTVSEMQPHSRLMALVQRAMVWYIGRGIPGEKSEDDPAYRMLLASSLDASMSNAQINSGIRGHVFEALVEMANGRWAKGLALLLKR